MDLCDRCMRSMDNTTCILVCFLHNEPYRELVTKCAKHFAEAGFLLKDVITTGISPQYKNTKNKSHISKNVEEKFNSDLAENMTKETSDIESTSKFSKKITNKKRKKSTRKKYF